MLDLTTARMERLPVEPARLRSVHLLLDPFSRARSGPLVSAGPAIVVIGMGNPLRRDDGVGSRVARQLEALAPPGVEVRTHDGDGPGLMDAWEGMSAAVVVDAVSSGAPAGTIFRFDASAGPCPHIWSPPARPTVSGSTMPSSWPAPWIDSPAG